jgi:hypothetical protein
MRTKGKEHPEIRKGGLMSNLAKYYAKCIETVSGYRTGIPKLYNNGDIFIPVLVPEKFKKEDDAGLLFTNTGKVTQKNCRSERLAAFTTMRREKARQKFLLDQISEEEYQESFPAIPLLVPAVQSGSGGHG